jgi:hypothetical protein
VKLSRIDIFDLALLEDVRMEGRKVLARPAFTDDGVEIPEAKQEPFTLRGELAADVTEEQAWHEVAEAYCK